MMQNIRTLLKDEGYFYCIIPDMYANIADFVVADHVNHFSEESLNALLSQTGFDIVEIDRESHYNAFIILAKKSTNKEFIFTQNDIGNDLREKVNRMSQYWRKITKDIKDFEEQEGSKMVSTAIYGSGFYGTYIAFCLSDLNLVKVFVDQSPHRQGLQLQEDVQLLYFGLNPAIAQRGISFIESLKNKDIQYYFFKKVY